MDRSIRTVGYLHSALPPLPTDLLYRAGAPDVLFVHGSGQAQTLRSQLDWPGERLQTIPSLRYRRDRGGSFEGFVFLRGAEGGVDGIELGVDDYLGKPYQEAQLLEAIAPLVERRRVAIGSHLYAAELG